MKHRSGQFDVVVIGGGHAGAEAAAAAARCGASVALVTMDVAQIGAMSCNPAIGGVGKGHLVRELDVFDGLLASAADDAAIHYRMLNASKGMAVRGPRVQADRALFKASVQRRLHATDGIRLITGEATGLHLDGDRATAVLLADRNRIEGRAVVIASGTFLGGKLHFGLNSQAGGRFAEAGAVRLSEMLQSIGIKLGRLKTGTPPRLDGRTIDWGKLQRQPSDAGSWTMSAAGRRVAPQVACGITRTNRRTHDTIRDALGRSPLYSGAIEGQGPRYCPSIEDKVVKFGDRDGHQIFLEPESLGGNWVYPNGISTSLPIEDQQRFVNSIEGLEATRIVQPGYAVEYDHIDPRSLDHRLASRDLSGVFFAGQVNGTTGYEEAAAQGLVAGLNAAASALDRDPILFDRQTSYIGVMIDDLVLQGITEPYRMLTARAEHRLHLRCDNAITRLGKVAIDSGAISSERRRVIETRWQRRDVLSQGAERSDGGVFDREIDEELAADRLYAPYVARQAHDLARSEKDEGISLAKLVSFAQVGGLSNEMVEKLDGARPATLGQARRIRGITPAALTAILVAAKRAA